MAIPAQIWYCGSTKWTAVTAWAALTITAAGAIVRQLAAPAVGSERVFVCIVAGTTGAAEPTWIITKGAKTTTDGTVTWMECTGRAGVNGDLTNTTTWLQAKNTAVALGQVIQRNSAGSLQICTTAGTTGNGAEPAFSNTAGTTTADNTATWTSLGVPSNFAAYAAPWARLSLALASGPFAALGDTVYVSNNHAETQSTAISYGTGMGGSSTGQLIIYCVSDTVAPPTTLATTATVTTTGASSLTYGGNIYSYGVNTSAGDGASNASLILNGSNNTEPPILENHGLALGTTSTTSTNIIQGNSGGGGTSAAGLLILKNPTIKYGATGQSFMVGGWMDVINATYAQTGSVPTTAFKLENAGKVVIRDTDLSKVTGTLFGTAGTANPLDVYVNNCKLGAGVTVVGSSPSNYAGPRVRLHNCDSANTNYRYFYSAPTGTVVHETTIVRTGGASDNVTPISWNVTTDSTPLFTKPFITEEFTQFNTQTGSSLTAVVEITTNATLNNNDCWLEVEYPSSASFPTGAVVTTRMTPLATPAALTTSSKTWGGGALTNKYSMSAVFTPQQKGPIKARVCVAKASITVYVDPYMSGIGSTQRSYLIPGMGYILETAGAIFSRIFTGQ